MVILAAVGEKHVPEQIIETGYDLATAYDDELRVLHVLPQDDADAHFEQLRTIPEFEDFGFDVELDRAEEVAERLIDLALEDYDAGSVTPVGRVGDPAEQILAVAEDVDARYVVIGGRKRTPTGKALFGSVTQTVVLESERPIVTRMGD